MSVTIALRTRDLRVHDNPVLYAACHAATQVVPLFVLDTAILTGGAITPSGGGAYFAVFTPYYRRWGAADTRSPLTSPGRITVPSVASEPLPSPEKCAPASPHRTCHGVVRLLGWHILRDWLARRSILTSTPTTTLPLTALPGCRPTYVSVVSPPPRCCVSPTGQRRAAKHSAGNWPGVTSTTRSSPRAPTPRPPPPYPSRPMAPPLRQAERYDPSGDYVRRYLPELQDITGPAVHQPWKLDPHHRTRIDYPDPIIDLRDGADYFHTARDKTGNVARVVPGGEQ
jgi:DNA photolyase-like FAD binding protein/DNA photolyase